MVNALNVSIPVLFFKEGLSFIAYSPVLDLSTSARTFKKAQKRFKEVVRIFFEELKEKETINEVLNTLGWRKEKSGWFPPIAIGQELTQINLPMAN